MIRRLIIDVFRRTWWMHAIGAAQLAVLWVMPAVMSISGNRIVTSLSMLIAFGLGPLLGLFSLHRHEVLLRPVSPRDLWRATWLYSTLAVPLVLALAKAAPVLLLAPISRAPLREKLQALLLSATYDAVYCGSLLIFLALALRVPRRDGAAGLWRRVCVGGFGSGIGLAFVFNNYVAPEWRALTPASSSALAIGAVAAMVSLFLAPPAVAQPRRLPNRQPSRPRTAGTTGLVASLSGFRSLRGPTAGCSAPASRAW